MQSYQLWWLFFEGEFMRLYEVDESYKKLILKELRFIYANKEKIKKTAIKLYNQKINNMSMDYIKHTIDFLLLEEKAKLYEK